MSQKNVRRVDSAGSIAVTLLIAFASTLPAFAEDPAEPTSDAADADASQIVPVNEVSITAQRGERDPLRVAGNVTVLDRKEIERTGARTIGELLERQPGLFVTRSTSSPAGVLVEARGFNNGGALGSSLLVQIDGRRANEPDTGNTDWSLLALDQIEAVEIVRGSASALYGDNAVGGVINIRTLPKEGPLRAAGDFYYGKHDTHGGSIRAAATVGEFTAGARFSGFDIGGYRDRSDFDRKQAEGSLEWNHGNLSIGGKAGYTDNFRQFPGALDAMELLGPRGRRAADPDSLGDESRVERWYAQAWLEAFITEDIQLRIAPQVSYRTDDVLITSAAFGPFSIDTKKHAVGVDAQLRVDTPIAGHENRFIAGFEFLYQGVESLSVSAFGTNTADNHRELYSGYVQEEFAITEKLLVTGGLRIDRAIYDIRLRDILPMPGQNSAEPDFTLWSPRASINYAFLPCLSGYFSYGRGFRLPNFDEEAPFFGAVPDLDPQISDTIEVGVKGRGDRISGSLSLYYMWVDDEILFDPFTFSNTNLDETRHRGIEAALDLRIFEWLTAYANYTLDDVEITSEVAPLRGATMPITPLHRGAIGLRLQLPCDFEINPHATFVGKRRLANDFDASLPQLDPYETVDLVAAWRPKINEHLSFDVTGGVYNLFDERYDGFGGEFGDAPFLNPATQRTWRVGFGLRVSM